MKRRKFLLRVGLAVVIIYLITSNFFLRKPFKDYKAENFKEVYMGQIITSYLESHKDQEAIIATLNALKRIRLTKEVPEPIISKAPTLINLVKIDGEVLSILESKPYLSVGDKWYEGTPGSFSSLESVYEKYMYNYKNN